MAADRHLLRAGVLGRRHTGRAGTDCSRHQRGALPCRSESVQRRRPGSCAARRTAACFSEVRPYTGVRDRVRRTPCCAFPMTRGAAILRSLPKVRGSHLLHHLHPRSQAGIAFISYLRPASVPAAGPAGPATPSFARPRPPPHRCARRPRPRRCRGRRTPRRSPATARRGQSRQVRPRCRTEFRAS